MSLRDLFSRKKKADETQYHPSSVGLFPTYEDAISDEVFKQSDAATKIEKDEEEDWEYLLFAQCLQDNYRYLGQFKTQNKSNPFVQAIGSDSEGSSYLQYHSFIIDSLNAELQRSVSKMQMLNDQFMEAVGAPGESGDPEAIKEVAIRFMDIYILFLAYYNDFCTVEDPPGLKKIHQGTKQIIVDMLKSFENYYQDMADNLRKVVANPDDGFTTPVFNCVLSTADSVTADFQQIGTKNPELLQNAKLHRLSF